MKVQPLVGSTPLTYHQATNRHVMMMSGRRDLLLIPTPAIVVSNCTMRFGPTLMTSARLLQEWPAIMSSPAYATATAAIQAVLRPG